MRIENNLKKHNQYTMKNIEKFFETEDRCCAIQATGTGKTYLILRLLEMFNDVGKRALILAPSKHIIQQTQDKMVEFELNNADFLTYQKLLRMSNKEIEEISSDLIVCDELHRIGAKKWGEKVSVLLDVLMDSHSNTKLFGVTATPIRSSDGRDISEEFFSGNKACEISLAEAILREIVTMPLYISGMYTFDEEMRNLSKKIEKSKNNTKEEKEQLQKELNAAKNQLEKSCGIPEIIKKYITDFNGKYIVFCRDKKHVEQMQNTVNGWFRRAGYSGDIRSYKFYSDRELKANFKRFRMDNKEGLKLLFVIECLNEGVHFEKDDRLDGCILLRPTRSNIVYFQQIGRVIDAGTKQRRLILDLVGNFNSLKVCNFKGELQDAIDKRKHGDYETYGISSDEFDIDSFNVVDMVQDVIDMFNDIDSKIKSKSFEYWSDEDIEILKKHYVDMGTEVKTILKQKHTECAISAKANSLGITRSNRWTENEKEIMLKYYQKEKSDIMKRLPNRNLSSIQAYASKLGITVNNTYSEYEDDMIKKYYKSDKNKLFNILNDKSIFSIKARARAIGAAEKYHKWSDDEIQELISLYMKYGIQSFKVFQKKHKDISKDSIKCQARKLGLKTNNNFTKEEDELLIMLYKKYKTKAYNMIPNRNNKSCRKRAFILGITKR